MTRLWSPTYIENKLRGKYPNVIRDVCSGSGKRVAIGCSINAVKLTSVISKAAALAMSRLIAIASNHPGWNFNVFGIPVVLALC
jgi:hypothetical protein